LSAVKESYSFPLSVQQQRLWLIDQLYPGHPAYNLSVAIPIDASVDHEALSLAANEMVRRHETLRTAIRVIDGEPRQVVSSFEPRRFPLVDLSQLSQNDCTERLRRLANENSMRSFDLTLGELFRLCLLRLGRQRHVLLLSMHHIISDGWSMALFWRELTQLYIAAGSGRPPNLPEPPIQYGDFAEWQREWLKDEILERQLSYWLQQLDDLPNLALPTDRPRPMIQRYASDTRRFRLPPTTSKLLRALVAQQGVTPFMILCAALSVLSSRYANQTDIVFGTPVTNRNRVELENVIGFFVNSLVLRLDVDADPSFLTLLKRVRQSLVDAYANQDIPFERLVEILKIERDPSRNPLFQVSVQLFSSPDGSSGNAPALATTLHDLAQGAAMFDLVWSFWESNQSIEGSAQFNTDLFDRETIERMCGHFVTLLGVAVGRPELPVSQLPLMTTQEQQQALALSVDALRTVSPFRPVYDEIAAAATKWPDRVALVWSGGSLTYAELMRRADSVAEQLRRRGIGRGDRVGIHALRSPEMVTAILGTMRAGAAWLPLEPELPAQRIKEILRDARPVAVLVKPDLLEAAKTWNICVLLIDQAERQGCEFIPGPLGQDDAAYLLYTSGSTGTAKGVVMPHRALANHMSWMSARFPLRANDTVLYKTPFGFDASIWEIFLPLMAGARLALAAPDAHRDPRALVNAVAEHEVTVLQLVPSMLRLFLDQVGIARCRSLRLIFAGGEPLAADLWPIVQETLEVELCNLYGPTETCIQSSFHICRREESGGATVPIGRAIYGTALYVANEKLELQPIGVAGELYIGGAGLASAYLGNPSLTAARFIPDPFGPDVGGRLYRTGDRVRRRADGTLEFLGRVDAQVKLRGFRVEPAEIEAALIAHPDVQRVAVIIHHDASAGARLVAYVDGAGGALQADLRRFLAQRLPAYMVPSLIMVLDSFPLLPSGKIDKARLPRPIGESESCIVPQGPIEEAIADVWIEILGVDRVGADDDFFVHLGGHSLLAIQVAARLRTLFEVDFPLRWLFEHPTVRGLAEALRIDPSTSERMDVVATLLGALDAPSDAPANHYGQAAGT
jgi:amino acid adenylation domain-containing protein